MKAICSEKEPNSNASRFVMLYPVEGETNNEKTALTESRTVSIRTFGYFDVFVGDTPIAFRSKKSKELFALLVDRKGGYVTSEEAISFLWEDEPVNTLTLSRYRKVALRLKSTLEEYGISDVVEAVKQKGTNIMTIWSEEKQELLDFGESEHKFFVRIKEADGIVEHIASVFNDIQPIDVGISGESAFITGIMKESEFEAKKAQIPEVISSIRVAF